MKFTFDEVVFKRNYAWLLSSGCRLSVPGFILFIVILSASIAFDYSLQLPDPYRTGIAVYSFGSFVAYPILSLYRIGERRRLRNSELFLRQDGVLMYDQQNERLFTIVGVAEERYLYVIQPGYTYRKTKSRYIISGEIEVQKKYLGKADTSISVESISIPIAFCGMERIEKSAQ